jgi:prophage maintenance system killer protein
MSYENKFNLQISENVFLAKKRLTESIFCDTKTEEPINMTLSETQMILDGIDTPNITSDEITGILNLRDAWRFILANISSEVNLAYISKINALVSRNKSLEWGVLRKEKLEDSQSDCFFEAPIEETVVKDLENIFSDKTASSQKAIDVFLYIIKNQLFWGGNKKTASLTANKILILGGAGILQVGLKDIAEFNVLLKEFYETGEKENLSRFLYEKCILGS